VAPWIAAAVLIVLGSVAMAVTSLPSGPAKAPAAVYTPRPSANGFVFGVDYADELPGQPESGLSRSLDDAYAVGSGWIRIDLAWYRIQPAPQTWDWSSFDRVAAYAKARNLRILAILDQPPAWARTSSCATRIWCPPKDATQFAAFAARAAQRYPQSVVGAWEVWNEENLGAYWADGPNPASYGALLRATATAVRAVQPDAEIVLGGLAVAGSDGTNLSAQDFLVTLGLAGTLRYASAIGYHPYSYPAMPGTAKAFAAIGTGPGSLAAVLNQYQANSTPIWLTEAGAPIGRAAQDPTAADPDTRHEEQLQAAYATELVKAATANPHVKALFWFSDIDLPAQHLYFGLRRADGTPRPSFTALENAINAYEN
jgi:hypothetical protein